MSSTPPGWMDFPAAHPTECVVCGVEFTTTRAPTPADAATCDLCVEHERGRREGARTAVRDASLDDLLAEIRRRCTETP